MSPRPRACCHGPGACHHGPVACPGACCSRRRSPAHSSKAAIRATCKLCWGCTLGIRRGSWCTSGIWRWPVLSRGWWPQAATTSSPAVPSSCTLCPPPPLPSLHAPSPPSPPPPPHTLQAAVWRGGGWVPLCCLRPPGALLLPGRGVLRGGDGQGGEGSGTAGGGGAAGGWDCRASAKLLGGAAAAPRGCRTNTRGSGGARPRHVVVL